jgi:hypothetical protein
VEELKAVIRDYGAEVLAVVALPNSKNPDGVEPVPPQNEA